METGMLILIRILGTAEKSFDTSQSGKMFRLIRHFQNNDGLRLRLFAVAQSKLQTSLT